MHQSMACPDPARQEAGRALANSHTWSAAARQHLTLYRSVLAATIPGD